MLLLGIGLLVRLNKTNNIQVGEPTKVREVLSLAVLK